MPAVLARAFLLIPLAAILTKGSSQNVSKVSTTIPPTQASSSVRVPLSSTNGMPGNVTATPALRSSNGTSSLVASTSPSLTVAVSLSATNVTISTQMSSTLAASAFNQSSLKTTQVTLTGGMSPVGSVTSTLSSSNATSSSSLPITSTSFNGTRVATQTPAIQTSSMQTSAIHTSAMQTSAVQTSAVQTSTVALMSTSQMPTSISPVITQSPTEGSSGLSSSEWAAVAIGIVIAALVLFVLVALLAKYVYERRNKRSYKFKQAVPPSETYYKNQAYKGDF